MTNPVDWQLKLTRQAERDLKKLSRSYLSRVYAELNKLKVDPSLGESLSGELAGARSLHFTLRGSIERRTSASPQTIQFWSLLLARERISTERLGAG